MDIHATALQGLTTASQNFGVAAKRIAAGPAAPVAGQNPGSFEGAIVSLKQSEFAFKANLQSLKAADEQSKQLLDILV